MKDENKIGRRTFLGVSSAAVLTGFTGRLSADEGQENLSMIEQAAKKAGKLPRRKLGYSQRDISAIIGSGDLERLSTEAGILCGMNYWHKANRWMRNGVPESILKNREAHICQVCVDRVGGNHYTGHFDEDAHVTYVKQALEETGLRYFDDMQLHFGYHNTKELKEDRGFVRAFDRLKKEGLVKHLCLSQHSYAGNEQVPDGQSAAEILTAVVEDGLYEHAQFMYSFGADPEMDKFIEYAKKKHFGTIAMKTARGLGRMIDDPEMMKKLPEGISPHNTLVRWVTTETRLTAAVIRVRNLDEFAESFSGAGKKMRPEDIKAMEIMTAQADATTCRLCSKCQPHCPQHIPITEILRFERYAMDDHDWDIASQLYAGLQSKADTCLQCGTCVAHCPLNLKIPEKILKAHYLLS